MLQPYDGRRWIPPCGLCRWPNKARSTPRCTALRVVAANNAAAAIRTTASGSQPRSTALQDGSRVDASDQQGEQRIDDRADSTNSTSKSRCRSIDADTQWRPDHSKRRRKLADHGEPGETRGSKHRSQDSDQRPKQQPLKLPGLHRQHLAVAD